MSLILESHPKGDSGPHPRSSAAHKCPGVPDASGPGTTSGNHCVKYIQKIKNKTGNKELMATYKTQLTLKDVQDHSQDHGSLSQCPKTIY